VSAGLVWRFCQFHLIVFGLGSMKFTTLDLPRSIFITVNKVIRQRME
jgi:hypothetical protein